MENVQNIYINRGRNLELAFRENLKKMRGTKSKEKFFQELEMSRSNYSRIESGKSDPTIKTLEQIAKLTNSTLVVDLIPNEPTEPESEQVTLDLEMEEEIISTLQNPQNTAISSHFLPLLIHPYYQSHQLDVA